MTTKESRRKYGDKYKHKPEMTREEVIAELRRLQAEGHSMKSPDFESYFYRRILKHFGGYSQAKKELGIHTTRKTESSGRKHKRSLDELVRSTQKAVEESEDMTEFREKYRYILDYSRAHLGGQDVIFELAGVSKPPGKPRTKRATKWTDELIEAEMMRRITELNTTSSNQFKMTGYSGLVTAVSQRYGTWNAGLVALGYEVAYVYRDPSDNLTKEETKEKVLNALARGIKPTRSALEKEIKGFRRSIDANFEGIDGLKKYCGFCAIDDRPLEKETKANLYRPDLTTVEGIKREIVRMWYIGSPMNYAYVREKRRHVLDAANKQIGSWKKAVESIGLDYDSITVTSNILSECGTDFENLFAEILTELGYEYIREGEGISEIIPKFTLKPDFILPNWRWIDCKLSEWTDIRETLIRYHGENPNGITIVYLRGRNHQRERGRKWKYEHISVYQFTKQLPDDRRTYYESELRKIERRASENTVAN